MRIVDIAQGTQEWLELRRTKRTASETPAIMGVSPWAKADDIAAIKTGYSTGALETPAMRYGKAMEAEARRTFFFEHGEFYEPAVLVEGDYLASLDGYGDGVVLEIKCPFAKRESSTWKKAESGVIEAHYSLQMQHQMMVSGASVALFYVFDGKSGLLLYEKADTVIHSAIRKAWNDFWATLKEWEPPMVDILDRDVCRLAQTYAELYRQAREAATLAESAKADLLTRMASITPSPKAKAGPVSVSRFMQRGVIEYEKIPALAGVALDEYRKQSKEVVRVTVSNNQPC